MLPKPPILRAFWGTQNPPSRITGINPKFTDFGITSKEQLKSYPKSKLLGLPEVARIKIFWNFFGALELAPFGKYFGIFYNLLPKCLLSGTYFGKCQKAFTPAVSARTRPQRDRLLWDGAWLSMRQALTRYINLGLLFWQP